MRNSELRVLFLKNFKNVVPLPSGLCGFHWEIHSHVNHCSPIGFLWLFSRCFFFVLSFLKFNYDVSGHKFLCIYHILDSLSFLNLCVYMFHHIWKICITISSNFPLDLPFSSPSKTPMTWMLDILVLSHRSLRLSSLFSTLLSLCYSY